MSLITCAIDTAPDEPLDFERGGTYVVVTGNTRWLITASHYHRSPGERTRWFDEGVSDWGRLNDDEWMAHRGAYWRDKWPQDQAPTADLFINVFPTAGPQPGLGLYSSAVRTVAWVPADLHAAHADTPASAAS